MTSYLVTGGSGTFGRAFIPHILMQGATRVVALSRHEVELARLEKDIDHPNLRCFIGDVRDKSRLELAMRDIEVVVHAAALKRIEQCQRDPIEAIYTNVIGTASVILAALRTGVKKAVLLSTDKASSPINVYGATKLLAEHLWLAANGYGLPVGCRFAAVRYGNIWMSRGSVVPEWQQSIKLGLPIRVTDPEATRFYMTQDQAVALVDRAIRELPMQVLMPYLPAYRLADLIVALGNPKYEVIGLPWYEKQHEELGGLSSGNVKRMTVGELEEALRAKTAGD